MRNIIAVSCLSFLAAPMFAAVAVPSKTPIKDQLIETAGPDAQPAPGSRPVAVPQPVAPETETQCWMTLSYFRPSVFGARVDYQGQAVVNCRVFRSPRVAGDKGKAMPSICMTMTGSAFAAGWQFDPGGDVRTFRILVPDPFKPEYLEGVYVYDSFGHSRGWYDQRQWEYSQWYPENYRYALPLIPSVFQSYMNTSLGTNARQMMLFVPTGFLHPFSGAIEGAPRLEFRLENPQRSYVPEE